MRFRFYVFLFIIVIVLVACSKDNGRKMEEILMARECGIDGFKCCDEDPACSFGQQCCVDPNDESRDYCADVCVFGKFKTFCLKGNECEGDLMCLDGYCDVCGGKNEVCCGEENICNSDLVCLDNVCVECGIVGNPCCENNKCFSDENKRAECRDGQCFYCGFDDNRACLTGDKCVVGNLFNNGDCLRCGDYNNPCCDVDFGVGYKCDSQKGLVCRLGFCTKIEVLE